MATVIEVPSLREGYGEVLRRVAGGGRSRDARGLSTVDAGHVTLVLDGRAEHLPVGTGRALNRRVAAIEALQLIGATSRVDLLLRASPAFGKFLEPVLLKPNGETESHFHGAYGTRVGWQVASVVRKLKSDPDSRQAVVTLWDPDKDNVNGKRDYPCTVALGFTLRREYDALDLNVLMRSNDAWLGLPYDVFMFNQLQWTVANVLGVSPGAYRHTAWSLHLYRETLDLVDNVGVPTTATYLPDGIHATSYAIAMRAANSLLDGDRFGSVDTESEVDWLNWYVRTLSSLFPDADPAAAVQSSG